MSTTETSMTPAILIQTTHGAENPEKATLPFIIGNVSTTADQDTVVFLTSDALWLAARGFADDTRGAGARLQGLRWGELAALRVRRVDLMRRRIEAANR
jgi:predicted peroxiredoxin